MALLAAIIMVVLASFIIVAIMVSARASADGSRSKQEDAASQELARSASTVLATVYSTLASGEQDGFVPTQATLQNYAIKAGGTVVDNQTLGPLGQVDSSRVPEWGRFTVRQPASDGMVGYWQVYSVKLPDWGVTKAGHVVVYIRTWTIGTTPGAVASKPAIYRAEFRPGWLADYQMLFDGPIKLGNGATLNGRIHSNGYVTSFYDQFGTWGGDRIRIDAGASCSAVSRITTSTGSIVGGPCAAQSRANSAPRINILRARDLANSLRRICLTGFHPSMNMMCPKTTQTVDVRLNGDGTATVQGPGVNETISGVFGAGGLPSGKQGAVIVLAGNATLHGSLPAKSRILLVTASPSTSATSIDYGTGTAPSVTVNQGGVVGTNAASTSSFGVVAEGDLIFNERSACGVTFRGAIVTMSGLVSINPIWRTPFATAGGAVCGGTARIEGSIAGHMPPLMLQPTNNAGYATRQYAYLPSLYDNPPPLYPTGSDWEVTNFAEADLDCFMPSGSTYSLNLTKAACT